MERFVLECKIPMDIWRELKTYLVHNIKTQAKYMKNEKGIINFNNALLDLPRIKPPPSGPKIVFNSAKKSYRVAKYIYHVQAFKPGRFDAAEPYRDGKLTIIAHCNFIKSSDVRGINWVKDERWYCRQQFFDYNKHFVSCAVPFRQTSSQDKL